MINICFPFQVSISRTGAKLDSSNANRLFEEVWNKALPENHGWVGSVARGWSGDPRIMALVRHLLFAAARQGFTIRVRHVTTQDNGAADALSRGDLQRFRWLRPAARSTPDPLPDGLHRYLAAPASGPQSLTGYDL